MAASERERWPVGEFFGCFDCEEDVHEADVELDERSPGAFFALCPDCGGGDSDE